MKKEEYEYYVQMKDIILNTPTVKKLEQFMYNLGVLIRKFIPLGIMYWFYTMSLDFRGVFWGYVLCGGVQFIYMTIKNYLIIEDEESEKDLIA